MSLDKNIIAIIKVPVVIDDNNKVNIVENRLNISFEFCNELLPLTDTTDIDMLESLYDIIGQTKNIKDENKNKAQENDSILALLNRNINTYKYKKRDRMTFKKRNNGRNFNRSCKVYSNSKNSVSD